MSDRMKDLLHEVADGVEPGDRLDTIRTATGVRRPGRRWWAAGGVGLVAASVVTAVALTTGGNAPSGSDPAPAEQTPSSTTSASDPPTRAGALQVWVYYVGDTPDGQRLYREYRKTSMPNPFSAAKDALTLAPLDPDYVSLWPVDGIDEVSLSGINDGVIEITVNPGYRLRPASMSPAQASMAVEQVIRTFQAATESTTPVQFYSDGNPIDQVLGVPTSEPLAAGSDLAVLAHVSLSDPSEGLLVDNDDPFTVTGVGNSFEGNIVTRIQRLSGVREVVAEEPAIAGTYEDRLFPFEVTFDLTAVPPGDYLVVSRTDDPSGEGSVHVDDRRITIVD